MSRSGVSPVDIRAGLARRHLFRVVVLHLDQLHEEVRLRQAEQCVDQSKVRLIKFHTLLHISQAFSAAQESPVSTGQRHDLGVIASARFKASHDQREVGVME